MEAMMEKVQQKEKMTDLMSKFISLVSYKLPDDVENKLKELSEDESNPLQKSSTTPCLKIKSWLLN